MVFYHVGSQMRGVNSLGQWCKIRCCDGKLGWEVEQGSWEWAEGCCLKYGI